MKPTTRRTVFINWLAAMAMGLLLTAALPMAVQAQAMAVSSNIPARPENLTFETLDFEAPRGEDHRHTLSNGVPVFIAEDHTLPLVSIRLTLKQGSYLDPPDKVGLASFAGSLMRTGGTTSMTPSEFDEQVEFLAASIGSSAGNASAGARLQCITPVLPESLALFFDMLRHPRYDQERLALEKGNIVESMEQRNDDADDILSREWGWLLFGDDHYSTRSMTQSDLEAITRGDLLGFHSKYWRPENMIIAVSGDVVTSDILETLETYLKDWPGTGAGNAWPPPQPSFEPTPGVYHVEKDIPQGKVLIGNLVPQWTDWTNPDRAAIQIMDRILGSGGFTSRIMARVRSDEGLAYSARSSFSFDAIEPGTFTVSFQSKSETVALAASIAREEVRRIQTEPVTEQELQLAKNSLTETFPQRWESAGQIAGIFASDAYLGRSHDYWVHWRSQVEAVTDDDVMRVAKKYLKPEEAVFLVVGKWEDIAPGDPEGRASMEDFFDGQVTHRPLRDPLTLEPLP